ncbi:MAG: hypothetical protein ACAI44_28025 [Candidatus Sericytochromatia bacterium]
MQNLNLKELAEQSQQLPQQSENRLDSLYQEGMEAFEQTIRSGFEDKQALQNSCRAFHQMIAWDARDPRPFLYTGYLLLLMGSLDEAEGYLQQASRLEPEEPDCQTLLRVLAQKRRVYRFASWDPELPRQEQRIDCRKLYGEVAGLVQEQLKVLMTLPHRSGRTVSDAATLGRMQEAIAGLERLLELLQEPLEILKESDAGEALESLMQPLIRQQQQLQSYYEICQPLAQLGKQISDTHKSAWHLLKVVRQLRSQADFAAFDAELDGLYDRCDSLADGLDAHAGQDIATLETAYEHLIACTGQIQHELGVRKQLMGRSAGNSRVRA